MTPLKEFRLSLKMLPGIPVLGFDKAEGLDGAGWGGAGCGTLGLGFTV